MGADVRVRKRELFDLLGYQPHPGQLLVHRSRARFRTLGCGTRWGKSKCAAMEAIAALLEPRERANGWLVGPTFDICTRIYDRVTGAIETKLGHRVVETSPREQRIVVTNLAGGISELRCKSSDRPVGLLGEELDFLIVDEAAQLKREVWEENLSPRLIDRKGWALLVSTPQGGGWYYEMFKRGQRNRDPECESWAFPTRDNPHVDPAVIEAERARLSKDTFAQQYEATFLGVPKEPCLTCGGPRPDAPGRIQLAPGQTEEQLPRCPTCAMFVDADGRCVVKWYHATHSGLSIDCDWSEIPETTMLRWITLDANGQWY